jgi:hypothetical protein
VRQLVNACRAEQMLLGFYYSPPERNHPGYRDTSKLPTEPWRGLRADYAGCRSRNCPSQSLLRDSYYFAGAVPASVYSPVQVYSNPPSAVPVVLQVPDPFMPFIFPVPPVI